MTACPKCGEPMARDGYTPARRQRWRCARVGGCGYGTTDPTAMARKQSGGSGKPVRFRRKLQGTQRFLVTAAQNATPVHEGFLKSLETACQELNAELLVVPIRYRNPTSRWSASQANAEAWAKEVQPYLFNARKKLHKDLVLIGDVKTQPTASSPLTGFDALTHGESGILAHTKLQYRTVPTPQNRMAKILTTTGAVTVPNYTDSKAGALGAFHHTLGACLVELDGPRFHLRQINASDDGSFIDLNRQYSPGQVTEMLGCGALVLGDTHVDCIDPGVEAATFNAGGMVETLKPLYIVHHDLLDGYAVNPHHAGNPFVAVAKEERGLNRVAAEIERALLFLDNTTPAGSTAIVVPSNHNDFLTRWLMGTDWRTDPANAELYLRLAHAMVTSALRGEPTPDPFALLGAKSKFNAPVRFLARDESFAVHGIELGLHGDKGPNGARGSVRNLRRIGIKSVIGHSHAPAIDEGCYQTGTSTRLRLEYNSGPSGWLNTHCVVYSNGKRSLLTVVDGRWRTT